ncbi:hypothetical protein FHEFKHOI_00118 [Candidatus Methanoperedenaceae archaeon GB50]|nr:hypothetical protein FHEFKHOI_00118 [Candidatus Methanoperedenaceae archaeon GB50]
MKGGVGELKGGGVVMIGPIPIIFASDKKYAIHPCYNRNNINVNGGIIEFWSFV